MKRRMATLGALVSLLALLLLGGCGPGKYVEKPNEELYGTWVNESYSGAMTFSSYMPQKSVTTPGIFTDYKMITSRDPGFIGKEEVTSKWKDSEGNIWYKIQGNYSTGMSTVMFQGLQKLTKSANVRELVTATVTKYDPNTYPTRIDSSDKDYRIYFRAKE